MDLAVPTNNAIGNDSGTSPPDGLSATVLEWWFDKPDCNLEQIPSDVKGGQAYKTTLH